MEEASSKRKGGNSVGDTDAFTQPSPLHWALPPERGPASGPLLLLPSEGLSYFLGKMGKCSMTKGNGERVVLEQ